MEQAEITVKTRMKKKQRSGVMRVRCMDDNWIGNAISHWNTKPIVGSIYIVRGTKTAMIDGEKCYLLEGIYGPSIPGWGELGIRSRHFVVLSNEE